jgi:hypothetical protein
MTDMKNFIILLISIFTIINGFSQARIDEPPEEYLTKDTVFETNIIYDFFRNEYDSILYNIGSVFLMPSDSISFKNKNRYKIHVTEPNNGKLKIYYKSKLLFEYKLINRKVEGTGYCYYPFTGNIALQGRFSNNKLNGLLFVQKSDGRILEGMKYEKGIYIEHIYHWLSFSKKSLRKRSKDLNKNPLKNNEIIEW